MRKLKTSDIFKASKIFKKMNIRIELPEKNMTESQAMIFLMKQALENLHLAEKEVNEFMADLIGISAKQFADLSIGESIKYFNELKEQEDIRSFLSTASKSTQP